MKRFLCGLLVTSLLASGAKPANADYIFTTLDGYLASGINDAGQVVGSYTFPQGGFLYSGGLYTPIKVPTSFRPSQTIASGINNVGQIVGNYNDAAGSHGFLRSTSGNYTIFDVPGFAGTTFAYGINNIGQIVGNYQIGGPRGPAVGFLLSGGDYITITPAGAMTTFAFGINDRGQIVGDYSDRLGAHGFLLSGSSYTTIDVPGSMSTSLTGINDAGDIVGFYAVGPTAHGFLLSDGSYTTIDVPGATFTSVDGINNVGQLVGHYGDASGNLHAFLVTPVPEPATLLLLGVAAIGLKFTLLKEQIKLAINADVLVGDYDRYLVARRGGPRA
jgi:uncharacterized membrane protein